MARGWESKSVEQQISDRDGSAAAAPQAAAVSKPPFDAVRDTRRKTLQLARSRAAQDLQLACDKRHKALLQETIAHLDAEIGRV